MQYRDFFPGGSRERIIFLKILSLYMVWFNCSTESSFLVFVCYESNAIQRLFSLLLKWRKIFFKFRVPYGFGQMQHTELFSAFCMF